jgi:uncharacterized Fe-S radical SAM superfamily protein PflX
MICSYCQQCDICSNTVGVWVTLIYLIQNVDEVWIDGFKNIYIFDEQWLPEVRIDNNFSSIPSAIMEDFSLKSDLW